jgi:hypothetical protein
VASFVQVLGSLDLYWQSSQCRIDLAFNALALNIDRHAGCFLEELSSKLWEKIIHVTTNVLGRKPDAKPERQIYNVLLAAIRWPPDSA